VVGGTINGTGSFVMKAERVGADTLLAQIVKMVSEANDLALQSSALRIRSLPGSFRQYSCALSSHLLCGLFSALRLCMRTR